MTQLDLITIGRSSVDLYGEQIGGRLEDMGSFAKYIGGSPTNIAAGTARLGLKSAVITRVGDEHMGRFIREQLAREGVDTAGVITDPERLTALVLLGIRDEDQFPLIFYRENCADMAICEDDIDPDFIASAECVTATGTHLSNPKTEAAVLKALNLARNGGARTALDIDYRPNLWGLAGHGDGESRFIESEQVTAKLQSTLHLFDLIVGTEEEFHIAGGTTDTIAALKAVRAVSDATLVCKRGPMGAVAFTDTIADDLDAGISGPGFPIEVFNVLGAGDGFMSGLLRGWLRGEDWEIALTWANACGAFAVSRHGCAPAYPSWEELQYFLEHGSPERALRKDAKLEHIHWATNRPERAEPFVILDAAHHVRTIYHDNSKLDGSAIFDNMRRLGPISTMHGFAGELPKDRDALYAIADYNMFQIRKTPVGETDFAQWPLSMAACFYEPSSAKRPESHGLSVQAARRAGLTTIADIGFFSGLAPSILNEHVERLLEALNKPDWYICSSNCSLMAEAIKLHDPWCAGIIFSCPEADRGALEVAASVPLVKGVIYQPSPSPVPSVEEVVATYKQICQWWSELRPTNSDQGTDR